MANKRITEKIIDFEKNDFLRQNEIISLKKNLKEANNKNLVLQKKIEEYKDFFSNYNIKNKSKKISENNKILDLVEELIKKEKEIKEIKSRYPF